MFGCRPRLNLSKWPRHSEEAHAAALARFRHAGRGQLRKGPPSVALASVRGRGHHAPEPRLIVGVAAGRGLLARMSAWDSLLDRVARNAGERPLRARVVACETGLLRVATSERTLGDQADDALSLVDSPSASRSATARGTAGHIPRPCWRNPPAVDCRRLDPLAPDPQHHTRCAIAGLHPATAWLPDRAHDRRPP